MRLQRAKPSLQEKDRDGKVGRVCSKGRRGGEEGHREKRLYFDTRKVMSIRTGYSLKSSYSFDFFFYSIFFYFLWELSSQINYGYELSPSVKPQCKGLTLQPCSGVGKAPNLLLTLKSSLLSSFAFSFQLALCCYIGCVRLSIVHNLAVSVFSSLWTVWQFVCSLYV